MALRLKSRKGVLLTLLTLVLFMVMVAELITYVQLNYSYNSFLLGSSQAQSSYYLIGEIQGGAALVLREGLTNALNALAVYESTPSLRREYFVNNTQMELQSLMLTGNVYNGVGYSNSVIRYMGNATILSYISSLQAAAKQSNVQLSLKNSTINIFQTSPFSVSASYSSLVYVNSSAGRFVYPLTVNVTVPLNGTLDLQAARIGIQRPFVGAQNFSAAARIGSATANTGSISPFMLDLGTIIDVQGSPTCANVPSQFQNGNYILAAANAADIPQSVCSMGGLVTYQSNALTPIKPYLVYNSVSNVITYLQNGTAVLLSGSTLSLLNISSIVGAANNGTYIPQSGASSYLDGASGNFGRRSQYGVFSFLLPNLLGASFNGVGSISTGTAGLPVGNNGISEFAWVNINTVQQNAYPVVYSLSGNGYNSLLGLSSGGRGSNIRACIAGSCYVDGRNTLSGQWVMVGFTFSGGNSGNIIMYLNGVAGNTFTGGTQNLQSPVSVIGNSGAYTQGFAGSIADVQVYNGVLSTYNVQTLYREGIDGTPVTASVVGWWPLDGNANDYSGYGNGGTAAGVTYAHLINYHVNPAYLGSPYSYPVSTPIGFGCQSLSNCNSSQLFLGRSNVWSTYYVPVTITNNQAAATAATFQQLLSFPAARYGAYEAPDLGNIRFYQGNQELYSWCEGGCSSAATNATFFVRLANGIAANSNVVLNMTFGPAITQYDGVYAGEAPQLSPIYAQYDNGAGVFNSYWNFAGSSLPSSLISSGVTYTVNNGLTATAVSGSTSGISTASNNYNPPFVVESYSTAGTLSGNSVFTGVAAAAGGTYQGEDAFATYPTGTIWGRQSTSSAGADTASGYGTTSTTGVWTAQVSSTSATTYMFNYGNAQTVSSDAPTYPLAVTAIGNLKGASSFSISTTWLRTRAYPPSGIMPSAAFGNAIAQSNGGTYGYGLDDNGFTLPRGVALNGYGDVLVYNTPINTVSGSYDTVSFWMYWKGQNNQAPFGGNGYGLMLSGSCLGFSTGSGVMVNGVASGSLTNKWVNVVGIFDNGAAGSSSLYINGVAQTATCTSGSPAANSLSANFVIGNWNPSGTYQFNGGISDLLIYSAQLTANQVAQLYLNGSVIGARPAVQLPLQGPLGGYLNRTAEVYAGAYGAFYGNSTSNTVMCTSGSVANGQCGVSYTP
jgi:hypothetical protein